MLCEVRLERKLELDPAGVCVEAVSPEHEPLAIALYQPAFVAVRLKLTHNEGVV
jgi:hypothetical protein